MQPIALHDTLFFSPGEALTLAVEDAPLSAGEDNLALRAARALQAAYHVSAGAQITLQKRIPMGAGLGGGSADAAAALRALWRLWRLDEATGYSSADTLSALCDVGVRLGADIPFCLHDAPRRAQGVGELLSPIAVGRTFPLVLIQPCAPLSTGEVFAAYHQLPTLAHPDTPAAVRALADGNLAALAACGGNVLESASIPMRPEIAAARQALWQNGAAYAQMTGSGSVVFGAFCDEAAACRAFLVLKGQYDACILTHTAL